MSSRFTDQADTNRADSCTVTENSYGFEILDFRSEGIAVKVCKESKGADQLRGYHAADLWLCFCICKKWFFS